MFAVQIVDGDGNILCHARLTPQATMMTGDTLTISLRMGDYAMMMNAVGAHPDEVDTSFSELVSKRRLVHGLNQS